MSNLINPKPRFGLNPDTGMLYDYVAQRDVMPTSVPYAAADGVWDLTKVKAAILSGETIESGHVSLKPPAATKPAIPAIVPPTAGTGTLLPPVHQPHGEVHGVVTPPGLSVAELLALKLSPLQIAALGITPSQLTATGVTGLQVKQWGLTAARADSLKLTPEQRAVLLP